MVNGTTVAQDEVVGEFAAPVQAVWVVVSGLEILRLADIVGTSNLHIASQGLIAREAHTERHLGTRHGECGTCYVGLTSSSRLRGRALDDHHLRGRIVGGLVHDEGGCGGGRLLEGDLHSGTGLVSVSKSDPLRMLLGIEIGERTKVTRRYDDRSGRYFDR